MRSGRAQMQLFITLAGFVAAEGALPSYLCGKSTGLPPHYPSALNRAQPNVGEDEERIGRNDMPGTLTEELNGNRRSFSETLADHQVTLKRGRTEILQLNLGKLCNLTCIHCHVNAGPKR